jgi:formylglycine-generating enzyme required for sulfatase activity
MSKYFLSIRSIACRFLRHPYLVFLLFSITSQSQTIQNISIAKSSGLWVKSFTLSDNSVLNLATGRPLFSFLLDGKPYNSGNMEVTGNDPVYQQVIENNVKVTFSLPVPEPGKLICNISFENSGSDTVLLSNVVPFGEDKSSVYITGYGPPDLARACIFRPGFRPVRIILPDNAWEMGYSSFAVEKGFSVCAVARRMKTEGGQKRRYETVLPPKSKVDYIMYTDIFSGEWQEGLRLIFRDKYLYDLEKFDNSLFERSDLAWIKESYLIILQMAWDREFYDRLSGKYAYEEMLKKAMERFGYIDVFVLWPTWPRLGLDQRNQWDMYRDLPGGINQLHSFVKMSHPYGTRFFIEYNPWDNSTRKEDHLKGMARLISETEADGVVLDTRGSSSYELQAAADSVRKGVIMYSEGMAITRDMPGIISGRVHNAIYLSPELNLNKLIKPDFSIFRVCDVGEDIIHREIAIAFFNGYGTELNMFRPGGRDENYDADLEFLARTTFTLRQNNDAFLDNNWTPLIETTTDNVYVNKWNSGNKTIFTVLNMRPEGIDARLFKADSSEGKHYVSIWNHEIVLPEIQRGTAYIPVRAEGWLSNYSGTRKEGSVDCIAEFPDILRSKLIGDSIKISKPGSGKILVWKGNPSVKTSYKEFRITNDTIIRVKDLYGYYEGKIVVQLIENKSLKDENVLILKGGKPWIISKVERTTRAVNTPSDMVLVPGSVFSFDVTTNEDFMPYPDVSNHEVKIDSFLIDKYPVTNAQYFEFIVSSGYVASDTARFLKHWEAGTFKQGQDNYPVVYLSYEDMRAYAKWAGKRLPTQAEWQLAAQGTDKRKWPWGNEFHGTYCNNGFDRPTPVDAFSKGKSPYGALDMVGNIWQMMNDMYFNGTNYFTVIRGGSYYHPDSSWWYIQGGPQQLDKTQIQLLVSPGFDRSSTVGFRCVKDVDAKNFKSRK